MYRGGWSFQILAADCETLPIGYRRVRNKQILLRVVGKLGGSVELAEAQMAGSNRGSVWVDVSPLEVRDPSSAPSICARTNAAIDHVISAASLTSSVFIESSLWAHSACCLKATLGDRFASALNVKLQIEQRFTPPESIDQEK